MASEVSGHAESGNSGTTIEIKIKTMDSHTYTLQVDKQMPVPSLKECIASVTGVVTDRQRLICRGKVLKDDQLLSAYHVEDGHTLHLVVREPAASSSEDLPGNSAFDGSASGNRSQLFQVAPGIVVETFNMPVQGTRRLAEISRLVSAVLGSMGVTNTGGSSETRDHAGDRHEEAPTPGSAADTTQISPQQSGIRSSNDGSTLQNAFGIPAGVSFGSVQAPVIPDALATLSQYLSRMRREFLNNGNEGASSYPAQSQNALPTPASLAELLSTTRQMLNQISEECLPQLARQLENQQNLTDSVDRENVQGGALRTGVLLQNLGAYFLELGRTVMMIRLGQSPSEAVVNAGPAVFVSPAGPNPLMVQPGASFGTPLSGNLHSGSGLTNGLGTGFVPRRMDVQIHREPVESQPATGISDSPSSNSGDGARVLPFTTVMTELPNTNRSPPESGSLGFLFSLLGRHPNLAPGNLSSSMESQVPGNMQTPESTAFQLNVGDSAGIGRATSSISRQRESVSSRTIDIDILSSGGIPTDQNAEGQIPPVVLQFLRGLFPGGEFQVESVSSEGTEATEVTEQAPPSGAVTEEAELRVTEEGLFLSRMLQQLMPLISQYPEIEHAAHPGEGNSSMQSDDATSSAPAEGSEDRTSRHRDDHDPATPNPKRQKME